MKLRGHRDTYRKEMPFPRESGLSPNLLSSLPVVSPVEFRGTSGSSVAFLSTFQHSPCLYFTDIAGGLHHRACHVVQLPPTMANLPMIYLPSPLRLLNWQGNIWNRHSWMALHAGQEKGGLFPCWRVPTNSEKNTTWSQNIIILAKQGFSFITMLTCKVL